MKLYYMFFVITLTAVSQNVDTALSNFKELKLPLVIDELTFNQLIADNSNNNLKYEEVKSLLISDDKEYEIKLNDTISNKLYSLGKFYVNGKLNLLIVHQFKNENEERLMVYLLNYFSDSKLSGYDIIASRVSGKTMTAKKVCLLNYNSIIIFKSINDLSSETYYYKYNFQKRFPYDKYDCEKLEFCSNYKPKLDSIPERNQFFGNFNKSFFKSKIALVPYKYSSIDNTTQVLSSIENDSKISMQNYYLDSRKLKDGKVIIFFLNDYNYKNYEIVREVGYQIFNKNGALSKQKQIALYHLDNTGIESPYLSRVFVDGNKLKIETGYANFEKEREILDLL